MATEMTPQEAMTQKTDQQVVRERWPDASMHNAVDEWDGRRQEIFVVSRPQPGAEKDCVELLSRYRETEAEAWADARKRVEAGKEQR